MSSEAAFHVGGVDIEVDNRTFGNDGGPAVRVFGDVKGQAVQLLRFDCFKKNPHYHYDPTGKNELHSLDRQTVPDPISWTMTQLREHLPDMIRTAGYESIAARLDQAAIATILPKIETVMRSAP